MTTLKSFSFPQAQAFLNGFTNYERIGLPVLRRGDRNRMAALLASLGDPQRTVRAIHVTGSKGKGTVCMVLEALLTAGGVKTGTYLSPHVECITERIRVGGAQLSRPAFAAALAEIRESILKLDDRPTYFEILTALAWWVFRRETVETAIVEAGIGARNDATALLDPAVAVVTSVEREHTAVLGRTEREILLEKLGLARAGVPLLLGPLKPHLRRIAAAEAHAQGAPCFLWQDVVRFRYHRGSAHVLFRSPLPSLALRFSAPDRSFAVNATIAAAAASLCLPGRLPALAAIIERCRIPARQELIPGTPPVLLDVAHTYHSLRALRRRAAELFSGRPVIVVFALAAGKDATRLLPVVESFAATLIVVRADPDRGRDTRELAGLSRHARLLVAADTAEAMQRAAEEAGPRGAVCVCGSFVLAGQARTYLRKQGRLLPRR